MTFLTKKWWWRRKWCAVRDFFNPQNKWARDAIPNHFSDVDAIFEDVLFNGLIFFWEEDLGEENLRHQYEYSWNEMGPKAAEYQDQNREIYNVMLEAYNWAKAREHTHATLTTMKIRDICKTSSSTANTCGHESLTHTRNRV